MGAYVDWNYFEMVDTLSRLIGRGEFAGRHALPRSMPTSQLFGFQMGVDGANNRNTNMGISGWFWYRGMIGGRRGRHQATSTPTSPTKKRGGGLPSGGGIPPCADGLVRMWPRHPPQHHPTSRRGDPAFLSIPALESADCTQLPDTPGVAEACLMPAAATDRWSARMWWRATAEATKSSPGPGHCPMLVRTAWTPFKPLR